MNKINHFNLFPSIIKNTVSYKFIDKFVSAKAPDVPRSPRVVSEDGLNCTDETYSRTSFARKRCEPPLALREVSGIGQAGYSLSQWL